MEGHGMISQNSSMAVIVHYLFAGQLRITVPAQSHPCRIFASHFPVSDPYLREMDKDGKPVRKVRGGIHHPPSWVGTSATFFITINCAKRGLPQLTKGETPDGIFQSFRFQNERQAWHASVVLLMPDHLHALIGFNWETGDGMKETIGNWKRFTARKLGIDWQRDFFDHRIRSDEDLTNKWIYIRENPVRAGVAKSYEEWPHVWRPPDRKGWT
jgi:REP element-mobilizing transposase RayT